MYNLILSIKIKLTFSSQNNIKTKDIYRTTIRQLNLDTLISAYFYTFYVVRYFLLIFLNKINIFKQIKIKKPDLSGFFFKIYFFSFCPWSKW